MVVDNPRHSSITTRVIIVDMFPSVVSRCVCTNAEDGRRNLLKFTDLYALAALASSPPAPLVVASMFSISRVFLLLWPCMLISPVLRDVVQQVRARRPAHLSFRSNSLSRQRRPISRGVGLRKLIRERRSEIAERNVAPLTFTLREGLSSAQRRGTNRQSAADQTYTIGELAAHPGLTDGASPLFWGSLHALAEWLRYGEKGRSAGNSQQGLHFACWAARDGALRD